MKLFKYVHYIFVFNAASINSDLFFHSYIFISASVCPIEASGPWQNMLDKKVRDSEVFYRHTLYQVVHKV